MCCTLVCSALFTAFYFSLCAPPSLSELGTSPQFTAQPSDVIAVPGRSSAINCRARGTPQPTIIWYKNDAKVVLGSRVTVNGSGALLISSVVAGDAGSYFCVANNTVGSVRSYSARLQLASKCVKQWTHYLCYEAMFVIFDILSLCSSVCVFGLRATVKARVWCIRCPLDNNKGRHSTVGMRPHETLYCLSTIFMVPSLHAV